MITLPTINDYYSSLQFRILVMWVVIIVAEFALIIMYLTLSPLISSVVAIGIADPHSASYATAITNTQNSFGIAIILFMIGLIILGVIMSQRREPDPYYV